MKAKILQNIKRIGSPDQIVEIGEDLFNTLLEINPNCIERIDCKEEAKEEPKIELKAEKKKVSKGKEKKSPKRMKRKV